MQHKRSFQFDRPFCFGREPCPGSCAMCLVFRAAENSTFADAEIPNGFGIAREYVGIEHLSASSRE